MKCSSAGRPREAASVFQAPMALGRTVLFQDSPVCSRATHASELARHQVTWSWEEGLTAVVPVQINRRTHHADILLTGQW